MTQWYCWIGAVFVTPLLFGCGSEPASVPPVEPPATIDAAQFGEELNRQLAAQGEDLNRQIADQLERREVDLKERKLILLVDGIRDGEHRDQIEGVVEALVDKNSSNWQVMSKGGIGDGSQFEISPIDDVEAVAAKIGFGAVLAVDVPQRTIVVDAGKQSVHRPASGWPGAAGVREFILRKTATSSVKSADENLINQVGAEQVVIVVYPVRSDDPWADAIGVKLEDLARKKGAEVRTTYSYLARDDFCVVTIGPMANVQTVSEALAGSSLWTDEKLRVIVLERPADDPEAIENTEQNQR